MGALYFLIPIALLFLAGAVWAFLWAVDHDQFEDLDREGERILLDDPVAKAPGSAAVDAGERLADASQGAKP